MGGWSLCSLCRTRSAALQELMIGPSDPALHQATNTFRHAAFLWIEPIATSSQLRAGDQRPGDKLLVLTSDGFRFSINIQPSGSGVWCHFDSYQTIHCARLFSCRMNRKIECRQSSSHGRTDTMDASMLATGQSLFRVLAETDCSPLIRRSAISKTRSAS